MPRSEEGKSIASSVAHLYHAGAERSRFIEKLRKAVDDLAAFLARTFEDTSREPVKLPRGFTFQSWASGEYKLIKNTPKPAVFGNGVYTLSNQLKPREWLLEFSKDVADGWLDELSLSLRKEGKVFSKATYSVGGFLHTHQGGGNTNA